MLKHYRKYCSSNPVLAALRDSQKKMNECCPLHQQLSGVIVSESITIVLLFSYVTINGR